MDWSNERYVRVYTRDTTTWKLMDWRGRCVLQLLMRKVDRAGVLDVGHDGVLGLAAVLELPIDIVEAGIAQLTTSRGGIPTVVDTGSAYILPNFIEAQEAPASDPQRKRESRARRRDVTLAASRNLLLTAGSGQDGHETGQDRDGNAEQVTPIRSDPCLADPDLSLAGAHAIPRTPEPVPTGVPTTAVVPAPREPSLDQLWSEFELERQRVAAKLGVPWVPLLAHDQGRDDLARALVDASTAGKRAELAATVRHAIAVAGAEVETEPTKLQWFSGAIFSPRNFRRLAAAPPPKAKRKPPGAAQPSDPLPVSTLTPEERSAAWAQLHGSKAPA